MIKYPVHYAVGGGDDLGAVFIADAESRNLFVVDVNYMHGRDPIKIAETVVNALNAIHKAPVPSLSLTIHWSNGKLHGKYVEWYNKFIKKGV